MSLAPPVQKDGFSYVGDSFYREASNKSHRRATIPELKAHFSGKDPENRPAHWYEAQLLHYGLPPSKVKGTAHKRLFDAVMAKGSLTVPANVRKIEADLKKEWNKQEREAKKTAKASSGAAAPARGAKRKAEQVSTNVTVNVSVQVSSTGAVTVDTAQPAAKKAKTTTSKKATTAASKEKKTTSSASSAKSAKPAAKTKTKTTAPARSANNQPAASSSSGYTVPGAILEPYQAGYDHGYDEPLPPAYSEFDPNHAPESPVRIGLGLLNGRYQVSCPYIEDNFPECQGDLGLIATLDGNKLWLKFDFGPAVTGLMRVDRPYEPNEDGSMVFWRGHCLDWDDNRKFVNVDTIYRAGPVNRLYFLGGGHIRGIITFDRRECDFDAYRLPGQPMTSEISPAEARAEWARLEQDRDAFW